MSEAGTSAIKLVVFDLGRVLVRICEDWTQACASAGIAVEAQNLGPADLLRLRDLIHQVEVDAIPFSAFATEAGGILGATPDQISLASAAFVVGLYNGVRELLNELAAAGVRTACLSNTNAHHWSLLSDSAHPAFFPLGDLDYQFASHLIGVRKPNEEIYAHLERETQTTGSEILFFDDVEENIEAAQRRGWNAQWIDPALDDPTSQIRRILRRHRLLP
ncbi:MAG TPA: HAD-IA family hydrolase [Tepidisphaeraceae bacterium]|jgi:putative hydrolase of the HAD superfamily